MLGGLLRNLKQFTARVQFEGHCPTVFAHRPLVTYRSACDLPTLDRFPQFSAIVQKSYFSVIQGTPKTAEIDQLGHSSCYHLPRSRSFSIRNRRQSALDPLISRRKRNAETRDRGCVVFRCECQFETRSTPSTSLGRPKLMTSPVFSFLSRRYVRHCAAQMGL